MTERPSRPGQRHAIETDLVEYVVVTVPDQESLPALEAGLRKVVDDGAIRVLDLVALAREADGSLVRVEIASASAAPDASAGSDAVDAVDADTTMLLTDHDVELAALALPPGMAGIVVLTEGRWAEPLALAARQAGGQIAGGERIPAQRIEAALQHISDGEGPTT
jgi:hypothetical protein